MTTPAPRISRRVSRKASQFTESVIREMTREAMKYGAVNLSQGFPDFAAPEDVKRVAMQAIADDVNQYAITWGAKDFRDAIAKKTEWHLGFEIDPEAEITVTCGSTEGMISAMMATVDPGEEVIVFETERADVSHHVVSAVWPKCFEARLLKFRQKQIAPRFVILLKLIVIRRRERQGVRAGSLQRRGCADG